MVSSRMATMDPDRAQPGLPVVLWVLLGAVTMVCVDAANNTAVSDILSNNPLEGSTIPTAMITIGVLAFCIIIGILIAKGVDHCHDRRAIRDDASDISDFTKDLLKAQFMYAFNKKLISKIKSKETVKQRARRMGRIWAAKARKNIATRRAALEESNGTDNQDKDLPADQKSKDTDITVISDNLNLNTPSSNLPATSGNNKPPPPAQNNDNNHNNMKTGMYSGIYNKAFDDADDSSDQPMTGRSSNPDSSIPQHTDSPDPVEPTPQSSDSPSANNSERGSVKSPQPIGSGTDIAKSPTPQSLDPNNTEPDTTTRSGSGNSTPARSKTPDSELSKSNSEMPKTATPDRNSIRSRESRSRTPLQTQFVKYRGDSDDLMIPVKVSTDEAIRPPVTYRVENETDSECSSKEDYDFLTEEDKRRNSTASKTPDRDSAKGTSVGSVASRGTSRTVSRASARVVTPSSRSKPSSATSRPRTGSTSPRRLATPKFTTRL